MAVSTAPDKTRYWLTIAVCVGAVVGGFTNWFMQEQREERARQQERVVAEIIATARHGLDADVENGEITLSGAFDTAQEERRILDALNAVDGAEVTLTHTMVLPLGDPFRTVLTRDAAALTLSGMSAGILEQLKLEERIGDPAQALVLHGGGPDAWLDAVITSLDVLATMTRGIVRIEDTRVTVSGLVPLPVDRDRVQAALTALPEGYTTDVSLEVNDDGRPLSLSAAFDGTRLTLTGKVPQELAQSVLNRARGLAEVTGSVAPARIKDETGVWPDIAFGALDILVLLDEGAVAVGGAVLNVSGTATDAALTQIKTIVAGMPDGVHVRLDVEPMP